MREVFEANARYWGWQIGVRHAQAYLSVAPLKIGDPLMLVRDIIPRP